MMKYRKIPRNIEKGLDRLPMPTPNHYYQMLTVKSGKFFTYYFGDLNPVIFEMRVYDKEFFMPQIRYLLNHLESIDIYMNDFKSSINCQKQWEVYAVNQNNDVVIIAYDESEIILLVFENQSHNLEGLYRLFLYGYYDFFLTFKNKTSVLISKS